MGTRGTWGFRINGKDYLTYNHFDSYPEGLGTGVRDAIVENKDSLDKLKENVKTLILVKDNDQPSDTMKQKYKNKFGNDDVSVKNCNDWYGLLREAQDVEIAIPAIINNELEHFIIHNDFIKDSLFCEYGYIINFDTNTLELYTGFQHEPDEDNRYGNESDRGYYPCKMVNEIAFENITPDINISLYFPEEGDE